jgi:hypothetical protein
MKPLDPWDALSIDLPREGDNGFDRARPELCDEANPRIFLVSPWSPVSPSSEVDPHSRGRDLLLRFRSADKLHLTRRGDYRRLYRTTDDVSPNE